MQATKRRWLLVIPLGTLLLSWVLLETPARATTIYGNFAGTHFNYLGVQETSTFGDPEPLFGSPIVIGDGLFFSPTSFSASASGAGGFDQTGSQLQTTIMATGGGPIDMITIDEFGEVDLSGIGTAATGAFISMSGIVTVLETAGSVPCIGCQIPFVGVFTPTDLYGLPGDLGQTLFQGSVVIDVGAVYPNATKAFLSLSNVLVASSEAGTTAIIEKKPLYALSVVPEPSVLVLLASGLIGSALRARARRS